jgi:CBS domain-containing protein
MKVKDIMTRDVITFKPEDTLHKALEVFTQKGISGAPVIQKGRLVGMVTEVDVIKVLDIYTPKIHISSLPQFFLVLASLKSRKKTTALKNEVAAASKLEISDFMSRDVVTIGKNEHIMEVAKLLDTYKINRLPVVEKGKLIGIVTRSDLIKAVARLDGQLNKVIDDMPNKQREKK